MNLAEVETISLGQWAGLIFVGLLVGIIMTRLYMIANAQQTRRILRESQSEDESS